MIIEYLAINTLFAMLSAVLIYVFLKINFNDFKCTNKQLCAFLGAFGLFNGVMSTLWVQLIKVPNQFQIFKPLAALLISIYVIKIVLRISWRETVTSFFVIMLAMGIGNFSTTILFSLCFNIIATEETTSNNPVLYFYANISIFIICLLVVIITHYTLKIGKIKNLKPVTVLLSAPILIMLIYAGVIFLPAYNAVFYYVIVVVSALIFTIFCAIFINKYKKSEALVEELKQQKFYNGSLQKTLQKLKRIKHDQADHLSVIRFMINNSLSEVTNYISEIQNNPDDNKEDHLSTIGFMINNSLSEAISYISELQNNPDNTINTAIYNIENVALYGIISTKIDKATAAGIKFNLKTMGTINSIPGVKVSDLCEILGNHLNNAIEAAEMSSRKTIDMSVIEYEDSIDIKISNSCDEKPIMGKLKKDGYSTKGIDRGHGLAIVEQILKKYKYVMNIMTYEESVMQFNQQLIIKKTPN